MRKLMNVSLCLFDDGTGAAASTAAPAGDVTPGVNPADAGQGRASAPEVIYGKQEDAEGAAPADQAAADQTTVTTSNTLEAKKAEFEKLIKGEYKDLFDERMQGIINKRFGATRQMETDAKKLQPLLDILGAKYGVQDGNVDMIAKALEHDTGFYESAANAQGLSVEQFKHMQEIERENRSFRQAIQEQERRQHADQKYSQWLQESEAVKQLYPGFDFESEIQSPEFSKLLASGVGVKAAYQATHFDDIVGGAMQYTAQTVAKKQADSIKAKASRPTENGISGQGGVTIKNDVNNLTDDDLKEIAKRVQRGEKIRF